jgi:NADH-quinone oxidoreductase subunit L
LLRVWPVLDVAPIVAAIGVAVGLMTALYATLVARTHADAKGALAHATLAQVGLILAEISAGLIELALVHLAGHAMLRVWQYLRAPNAVHDAHRLGHAPHRAGVFARMFPTLSARVYASALHRFRLDERLDRALAPLLWAVRKLEALDAKLRGLVSLDHDRGAR